MHRFGLKLWSINDNYIEEVVRLKNMGMFDYIELFVAPGTQERQISMWCRLKEQQGIRFILHAPHFIAGMNLAKRENLETNVKMAKEAYIIADQLQADRVIFHPGIGGDDKEIVFQLNKIADPRMLIENKPYYPLVGIEGTCNGYSPESIKLIMENTGAGFCLDIGHAVAAANAIKQDRFGYLKRFLDLRPNMFHVSDGNRDSIYESHSHIGKGNYDLCAIMGIIPRDSNITIETEKQNPGDLKDYVEDVEMMRKFQK